MIVLYRDITDLQHLFSDHNQTLLQENEAIYLYAAKYCC
jgi:hypothetical protein